MPENSSVKKEEPIIFENGNQADLIQVSPGTDAAEILSTFNISKAPAVILVCGTTKPLSSKLKNRLHQITIEDTLGLPYNDAIVSLINKALIDSGIRKRFYKFTEEEYNLAFVEPKKYIELINEFE